MEIDRRAFIASLGGATAVSLMDSEARANALENYMMEQLDTTTPGNKPAQLLARPAEKVRTVAELNTLVESRNHRRGIGNLLVSAPETGDRFGSAFVSAEDDGKVKKLEPLPPKPTLQDYFKYRFAPARHVLQSADMALKKGLPEETVLACLLHDTVLYLIKPDHGWWGAQLYEPYVSEKIAFAIRYHQALRFYPDDSVGYEYPEAYLRLFGSDYTPPPYIEATYKFVRNHKWYMEPRLVTVNDLYAFDPKQIVTIDPFIDIIGRHFKQPKEGLGYDNSLVAHMWRTIANPDSPL